MRERKEKDVNAIFKNIRIYYRYMWGGEEKEKKKANLREQHSLLHSTMSIHEAWWWGGEKEKKKKKGQKTEFIHETGFVRKWKVQLGCSWRSERKGKLLLPDRSR